MNKEKRQAVNWKQKEQVLGLEQVKWHCRMAAMYEFLNNNDRSIIDLGAGNMYLKRLLPDEIEYYPVDYQKRFSETIVCDFNKYEFPDIYADVIVCAGILEYIDNPEWFLEQVTIHCRKVLLSYQGREKFDYSMLRSYEIIDYMQDRGFCITQENKQFDQDWTLLVCFEKVVPKVLAKNINCTGCGACANICMCHAISMEYDTEGYLKPYIDDKKCIGCQHCIEVCPVLKKNKTLTEQAQCYAAWGPDNVRLNSSSGGAFAVIAQYIIEQGGYVFGAVWSEDFFCYHIGINNMEQIPKLKYSKYVQSNTRETFREVKKLLKQNIPVVYFGTPCQIAGLNEYLGDKRNHDKFIAVDLICFSAPSNIQFRKYLQENYGIDKVQNVTFREKTRHGWSPVGYKIELKNGTTIYPEYNEDYYQQAFHSVLARNDVCEKCKFSGFPRQGDLTLGDFWGVEQHDPSWNDGNGTSAIFVNSSKGKSLMKQIEKKFKRIQAVPVEWTLNKGNRLSDDGRGGHIRKIYFERLLKKRSFNHAVEWALKNKHDIGLVCVMNHNIGNNLTNFALYQYLSDQNYMVLMIDAPTDALLVEKLDLFLKNPYFSFDIAENYVDKKSLAELNELCSFFILGSDQLLRNQFIQITKYHTCLDWVSSEKFKITYAASFGVDEFEGAEHDIEKVKYFMKRIQKISVREKSGVGIMKNYFAREAEWVLDPVFLCDIKYYDIMAQLGIFRIPTEAFVGAYILDPTLDKKKAIKKIANLRTNGKELVVLDAEVHYQESVKEELNILSQPKVEEWLAVIKNCNFFITDSFHGLCFALIFQKPFCVIFQEDSWRGIPRIQSLLELLDLQERMVHNFAEFEKKELWNNPIDFRRVEEILSKQVLRSKQWLLTAIESQNEFKGELTTYDILKEKLDYLSCKLEEQMLQNYNMRNDIFMLNKRKLNYESINNSKGKNMEIVGFGAGNCFLRNIKKIKKIYNLRWICDNDPDKWGKEVAAGVKCISPATLKEMPDVLVIIMVDSITLSFDIANELLELGITKFDHFENWMKYIENCT